MDLSEPAISQRLSAAITDLIVQEPDRFASLDDPRGAAGQYLAQNNPEVFDQNNPADMLALELSKIENS